MMKNYKKIITILFLFLSNLFNFSYAMGIINGSTEEVYLQNTNVMQKLINILIGSNELQNANFSSEVDFQGSLGGGSPVQNICKAVTDPEQIKNLGLLTSKCPEGTSILNKDLGFNKANGKITCGTPISGKLKGEFLPKIKIAVEGKCSGGELCKGIEPRYDVDKNNPVNISFLIKPGAGNLAIGSNSRYLINPIWKNTIKIYINSFQADIGNLSGDITTEGWNSSIPLIQIDGTGGPNGILGINYVTIKVCDHPIDSNTGNFVNDPTQTYKLNCNIKTFVIKTSPTSSDDATNFSALNQKKAKCSEEGYSLPQNAKWIFPVQIDGSFYQSCNNDGGCTPSAESICNYKCNEGYIKDTDGPDGIGCYSEKQLKDCNLAGIGTLGKNEEWKAPNSFSGEQNVNPETGQFYGIYNLDNHTYTPNLQYCMKGCKDGYKKDINDVCQPIEKEVQCKNYFTLSDMQKYNGEYLEDDEPSDPEYTITSYWEDKINEDTGEKDGLIEESEYDPDEDILKIDNSDNPCGKSLIANSKKDIDNGKIVCEEGYVAIDTNEDAIIDVCKSFDKDNNYIVFNKNESEEITYNAIKNGQNKAVNIISEEEATDDFCQWKGEEKEYYYNEGTINVCIK